jgi:hypothetical protein
MGPQDFACMDEFLIGDARRWTSEQRDYAARWRAAGGSRFHPPQWRLSYIRATGEVYAVSSDGPVHVLGVVPPAAGEPGTPWHYPLDALLGNWADPARNDGFSLGWVESRVEALAGYSGLCRDAPRYLCPPGYSPGSLPPCLLSGRCDRLSQAAEP